MLLMRPRLADGPRASGNAAPGSRGSETWDRQQDVHSSGLLSRVAGYSTGGSVRKPIVGWSMAVACARIPGVDDRREREAGGSSVIGASEPVRSAPPSSVRGWPDSPDSRGHARWSARPAVSAGLLAKDVVRDHPTGQLRDVLVLGGAAEGPLRDNSGARSPGHTRVAVRSPTPIDLADTGRSSPR